MVTGRRGKECTGHDVKRCCLDHCDVSLTQGSAVPPRLAHAGSHGLALERSVLTRRGVERRRGGMQRLVAHRLCGGEAGGSSAQAAGGSAAEAGGGIAGAAPTTTPHPHTRRVCCGRRRWVAQVVVTAARVMQGARYGRRADIRLAARAGASGGHTAVLGGTSMGIARGSGWPRRRTQPPRRQGQVGGWGLAASGGCWGQRWVGMRGGRASRAAADAGRRRDAGRLAGQARRRRWVAQGDGGVSGGRHAG
jgi:hypothetical protein